MSPYFFHLKKSLIIEETKKQIYDLTFKYIDSFISYKSQAHNREDGNNYLSPKELRDILELRLLIDSLSIKAFPLILMHKPNSKVVRHKDDPNKRNTVIIIPISDINEYTPTFFWHNLETMRPSAICNPTEKGIIFNTQKYHSLSNNKDSYRINFQLCFNEPFDHIVELYENDKLFLS